MGVVLYNLLLLGADGGAFWIVRKRPAAATAVNAVVVGGFGAAFLGTLLGGGFFGILGLWAWAIFAHGLLVLGAMGAAMWKAARMERGRAPRLRFRCRPEVVIDLWPAGGADKVNSE